MRLNERISRQSEIIAYLEDCLSEYNEEDSIGKYAKTDAKQDHLNSIAGYL